ncbi:hypothetical protein TRFO_29767 [Tritrichomonas foetus]|uniref:MRH domain-containing protein n=1 Tax=Tritrichomonas foetus TaxID=1144522 RepID=A0A1J4JVB5_9EUKA|nr:hypothetical protein TRFO_29767 [Tritrichomonas foetus]|eukprot:OHT02955.1 hypothetical protein TRFO_29767 [Tritrichomonas foetus]
MFLFSLFNLLSCARQPLFQSQYPIDRDFCKVNIDGYQYSLLGMANRVDKYKPPNENYTYIMRICKEITQADLPINTSIDLSDAYVVRCDTKECQVLIHENSFDWTFYNANDKASGVIYHAIGEPFKISDISYYTFDVQYNFMCNPDSTDPDVAARYIFSNIDTDESLLKIMVDTAYGCGQGNQSIPTPTPNPFTPNCDYTDRYDELMDYGIDLHLGDMNGGPYGIRSVNLSINSGIIMGYLFYQPCERMECPPGYKCKSDSYSSAWFCLYDSHECESWGIIRNQEKFVTPQEDLLDGVNVTFTHETEDKKMVLMLGCDRFLPKNHIDFASKVTKSGNEAVIKGRSQNACIVPLPDPTPKPEKCKFEATNPTQKSTITLNMVDYDKGDMVGWTADVKISSTKENAVLYYEPCDNVFCPKGAYCEGDEDATIYLCKLSTSGKQECAGYGLLNNSINMYFMSVYDITEGVKVDYSADLGRTAVVNWRCDSTLASKQLRLPTEVSLYKNELSFEVYSKDACGSGNPTPRPEWHPPKPTIPPNPTPTPQPSVNPTDVYVINETHYILTPLSNYQQDVFKGNLTIMGPSSQEGKVYAEFHPWKFIDCPAGYECSANQKDANFWACWIEDDKSKYCHAIGDTRIKNEMYPMTPSNPDRGVELIFGGVWGLDTHFDIECDKHEDNYSIPFDHATVLSYSQTRNGTYFKAFLDSGAVCPREFEPIRTPVPAARQTPAPGYVPQYQYSKTIGDKMISINLGDLETHTEIITIGLFPHYQRNLFRYYPKTPGAAPTGYRVIDTDKTTANVWRCFNLSGVGYCHTCGDLNINLDYQLVKQNDLSGGLSLNYEGGYGQYETHVQLICNESIKGNEVDFDDVGFFTYQMKSPIIFAHTSLICPKSTGPTTAPTSAPITPTTEPTISPEPGERSNVTGGSIFLFIVIAGLVLYLAIGVLVGFVRQGTLGFPNADFWEEFFECVVAAVTFIFTCGKKGPSSLMADGQLYEKAVA